MEKEKSILPLVVPALSFVPPESVLDFVGPIEYLLSSSFTGGIDLGTL